MWDQVNGIARIPAVGKLDGQVAAQIAAAYCFLAASHLFCFTLVNCGDGSESFSI
jgi:hypothetical protein